MAAHVVSRPPRSGGAGWSPDGAVIPGEAGPSEAGSSGAGAVGAGGDAVSTMDLGAGVGALGRVRGRV